MDLRHLGNGHNLGDVQNNVSISRTRIKQRSKQLLMYLDIFKHAAHAFTALSKFVGNDNPLLPHSGQTEARPL